MISSHAIKAFSYWLLHSVARQVAPLKRRVAKILNGIEADRKQSRSRNVHGLVFTRENGKRINKDAISGTLKRACRDAKSKTFGFMILGIVQRRHGPGREYRLKARCWRPVIVRSRCINATFICSETTLQKRLGFCNMVQYGFSRRGAVSITTENHCRRGG